MKVSRRVRRIERRKKIMRQPMLNLVSLMDIFTILVFFLLVNSSDTQQLPSKKDMTLPVSIASAEPKETVQIMLTLEEILVDGQAIMRVDAALQQGGEFIEELTAALEFQALKNPIEGEEGGELTIVADENLPYELVDKVLQTCQQVNFRKIAFAVMQKAKKEL